MLEIALGSALMYYAAKEALDIKNSPQALFTILKFLIQEMILSYVCTANMWKSNLHC